jgi:23S rRNA U2552 (ribose-2'-O)-methylase RlmE/FtsJ
MTVGELIARLAELDPHARIQLSSCENVVDLDASEGYWSQVHDNTDPELAVVEYKPGWAHALVRWPLVGEVFIPGTVDLIGEYDRD